MDRGVQFPNDVVLSPDQTLLYVADSRGRFVYSFQVQADGSLKDKQPFFHLHIPVNARGVVPSRGVVKPPKPRL